MLNTTLKFQVVSSSSLKMKLMEVKTPNERKLPAKHLALEHNPALFCLGICFVWAEKEYSLTLAC